MKFLIFSHESPIPTFGGHREYLMAFLKALDSDGHEITVISWGKEKSYITDMGNIHIRHFNFEPDRVGGGRSIRHVNYNSSIAKIASRSGVAQYTAIRYGSPDNDILKSSEIVQRYDFIIKSGPNASVIPFNTAIKTGAPFMERLDWFGLPRTISTRNEWLSFLGERELMGRMLDNTLHPLIDRMIKKKELSVLRSRKVYVPSMIDCKEISEMKNDLEVDYVFPFLEGSTNDAESYGHQSGDYVLFFASVTFSSLLSIRYLHLVSKLYPRIRIYVTGNFEEFISQYSNTNFKILGKVKENDFIRYLSEAKFVVFPSLDGHGVQMRLVRAFSFGKAIIATSAICSSFTGLKDGENIVIRDTPSGFLEAMIQLDHDDDLRHALEKNSISYYNKYLTAEKSMERFYTFIKRR